METTGRFDSWLAEKEMTSKDRLKFYTTAAYTEHYLGMRWPRAIWQAVLEQAIADVVEGPSAKEMTYMGAGEAAIFRGDIMAAAAFWIDDEANEPRRFVWVCEQLDLDPAAVRKSIERRMK